jgi:hypothetical protein
MTEFKIVEIIARRFRNGKEEVQVQWGVTWEPVDANFAKGQLYKEFMEDLQKEEQSSGEKEGGGNLVLSSVGMKRSSVEVTRHSPRNKSD